MEKFMIRGINKNILCLIIIRHRFNDDAEIADSSFFQKKLRKKDGGRKPRGTRYLSLDSVFILLNQM